MTTKTKTIGFDTIEINLVPISLYLSFCCYFLYGTVSAMSLITPGTSFRVRIYYTISSLFLYVISELVPCNYVSKDDIKMSCYCVECSILWRNTKIMLDTMCVLIILVNLSPKEMEVTSDKSGLPKIRLG